CLFVLCLYVLYLFLLLHLARPPLSTLFPYTTLFRSDPRSRRSSSWHRSSYTFRGRTRDSLRLAPSTRRSSDLAFSSEGCSSRMQDRKSTRLNSSHQIISYAVFCLKKKKNSTPPSRTT